MDFVEIFFYTLTNYADFFLLVGILVFWLAAGPNICWWFVSNTYGRHQEERMVEGLKTYYELKDKGHKPNLKEFLK